MKNSKIAWTQHTFNPWWGCVRVSEGCVHCYAETFSKRTGQDIWGVDKPRRFFADKHWNEPKKWNDEAKANSTNEFVFCASMADWAEDRDDLIEPRARLCKLVEDTPNLIWLLLTKRVENVVNVVPDHWLNGAPRNAWFGVTTENQNRYDERINILLGLREHLNAAKVWLSIEPQVGPVDLRGKPVDWVIVGGESGAGCRPFSVEWARSLREQSREVGAAYFLKQLGGHPYKKDQMEDFPEDLRIRELPR
jgi:protein gp37